MLSNGPAITNYRYFNFTGASNFFQITLNSTAANPCFRYPNETLRIMFVYVTIVTGFVAGTRGLGVALDQGANTRWAVSYPTINGFNAAGNFYSFPLGPYNQGNANFGVGFPNCGILIKSGAVLSLFDPAAVDATDSYIAALALEAF